MFRTKKLRQNKFNGVYFFVRENCFDTGVYVNESDQCDKYNDILYLKYEFDCYFFVSEITIVTVHFLDFYDFIHMRKIDAES